MRMLNLPSYIAKYFAVIVNTVSSSAQIVSKCIPCAFYAEMAFFLDLPRTCAKTFVWLGTMI